MVVFIKGLLVGVALALLAHCAPIFALELGDIPVNPVADIFVLRMGDDRVYMTWQSPRDLTVWPCYYVETDEFYRQGEVMRVTDTNVVSPPTATSPAPWSMGAWMLAVANGASLKALDATDVARCTALRESVKFKWPQSVKVVAPALSKFVVGHNSAMTTLPNSRPLVDSTTWKQIGTQRALEGQSCGDAEVRNTSGTIYHPHTNAAGVSGVTICVLRK